MRSSVAAVCLLALASCLAATARAQDYPRQTIKLVVPFPPGGAADILARALAQKMAEDFKQSVIVDNRPGVAGSVGQSLVAHAANDGYTIGLGSISTLALTPFMSRAPLYDPRKDFAPVALLTELPILFATPAQLPGDFKGLVDYAKAADGRMNFSSNGVGSQGHVLGIQMMRRFGFTASHVPYGGDVPIINALVGQQVQLGLLAIPAAAEFIKAGRINAPAISGARRSPLIPMVPTVVELGYPELETSVWFCIDAPAGTPTTIVQRLNREINAALADPQVQLVFKGAGLEPAPMELPAFEAFVAKEQNKWEKAIKDMDLRIE